MRRLSPTQKLYHQRRARRNLRWKHRLNLPKVLPTPDGQRFLNNAMEAGWVILPAPRDLSWADTNLHRLCTYLAKIRREVSLRGRKVIVDLSPCSKISSLACMMLAAEIERCQQLHPDSINGLDPLNKKARAMLYAMGFYEHLKMNRPPVTERAPQAIQIRSGLGSDETIAADAHEVAELANKVFEDDNFAKRVHSALNEALGNVQMHAYANEAGVSPLAGRWWIAGLVDHKNHEAYFFALDHGVGIPATAPKSMGEALASRLSAVVGTAVARDHQILQAVVDERRTRTKKAQHGKGIASMISLIELAGEGEFRIFSGKGLYLLDFVKGGATEPQAFALPLGYTFPGTLIIWRVAGPAENAESTGDDGQSDQSRE
ncbi:hypothetical protein BSP_01110 [Brevundimonas sp. Bb-A]|jgi:hypothetical protein|nr:hypothetical protein BSP_01110 [Brevundimonas sp. Bb-A]